MLLKCKRNQNYLKVYECPENNEKFGLVAINGNMKQAIIEHLQTNLATYGSYVKSGGALSEFYIPSMLAGGSGAFGLAAATSGTLFMATVNPATLMTLGNGVGSAVMGASGIVAQAPFIAATGAIMPVVAPLLAFQALSTIMLMQQFTIVNEKLNQMQQTVGRILQRNEATFIGELISAGSRLNILEKEYTSTHRFSDDMKTRLALVEDKVNPYFERYQYLHNAQAIDKTLCAESLRMKNLDAYMATLLSVLDLQIDVLRLKMTLQENPAFVSTLINDLIEKTERYETLWNSVENNPRQVEGLTQSLQETISAMNGWQKHMPRWLGGKRDQRKLTERMKDSLSELNTRDKTNDMIEIAKSADNFGKKIKASTEQISLLYWEDSAGKHSYYTNDIIIK